MKLPRDVSSAALEKALHKSFGYVFSRQVGSHRRLTTQLCGTHHLTIPAHNPIKPGTLKAIIREVATHGKISDADALIKLDL